MTTEIFNGTAEKLKIRLDALIVGGATNIQVIPTTQNSVYLLMYTP